MRNINQNPQMPAKMIDAEQIRSVMEDWYEDSSLLFLFEVIVQEELYCSHKRHIKARLKFDHMMHGFYNSEPFGRTDKTIVGQRREKPLTKTGFPH